MKIRLLQLAIGGILFSGTTLAAPPVVSNVIAAQRPGTKFVDIQYDLTDSDGDVQLIQVQVSGDGGLTYTIPCVSLSGQVGPGIAPGLNRRVIWNAGADWNGQFVQNTKLRVTAYDGTSPPPPPGMVLIPTGTFQMGDNFNEGDTNERPVHNVEVSGFFMDKFEVSRELWEQVVAWGNANGYATPGGAYKDVRHPVHSVSWEDAVKWCNARSQKEGLTPCYYIDEAQTTVYRTNNVTMTDTRVKWNANGYRLPTEAEWEKAARGGAMGLRYPWGNTINGSNANWGLNSGDAFEGTGWPETTPIGYYNGTQTPAGGDMANGYGLHDMAGNLWEWCWDWFGSAYYGSIGASSNPHGPSTGSSRVLRGGSWNIGTSFLRCSKRDVSDYISNSSGTGFRCVRGA